MSQPKLASCNSLKKSFARTYLSTNIDSNSSSLLIPGSFVSKTEDAIFSVHHSEKLSLSSDGLLLHELGIRTPGEKKLQIPAIKAESLNNSCSFENSILFVPANKLLNFMQGVCHLLTEKTNHANRLKARNFRLFGEEHHSESSQKTPEFTLQEKKLKEQIQSLVEEKNQLTEQLEILSNQIQNQNSEISKRTEELIKKETNLVQLCQKFEETLKLDQDQIEISDNTPSIPESSLRHSKNYEEKRTTLRPPVNSPATKKSLTTRKKPVSSRKKRYLQTLQKQTNNLRLQATEKDILKSLSAKLQNLFLDIMEFPSRLQKKKQAQLNLFFKTITQFAKVILFTFPDAENWVEPLPAFNEFLRRLEACVEKKKKD